MPEELTPRQQMYRARVAEAFEELSDALAAPLLDSVCGKADAQALATWGAWLRDVGEAVNLPPHAFDDDFNEVLAHRLYGPNKLWPSPPQL